MSKVKIEHSPLDEAFTVFFKKKFWSKWEYDHRYPYSDNPNGYTQHKENAWQAACKRAQALKATLVVYED